MELGNVGVHGSHFVVDCCSFRNDKTGSTFGAALIIACYIAGRYTIWRKLPGHGGHNNSVVEAEFASFKR